MKKAVVLYELSADQGNSNAQYHLALCYRDGKGVEKDNVKAYAWLKIASQGAGAKIQQERDKMMETMSSSDLTKANEKADEIMQQLMTEQYEINF